MSQPAPKPSQPKPEGVIFTLPRPKGWPPLDGIGKKWACLALALAAGASACVNGSPVDPSTLRDDPRCVSSQVWVTYDPYAGRKPGPQQADSARFVCLPKGVR